MISIRTERPADVAAREALLDVAFGPVRFDQAVRAPARGRLPAAALSFVAHRAAAASSAPCGCGTSSAGAAGRRCCSARSPSHPDCRGRGIGAALMRRALARRRRGAATRAVLLVGDAAYYGRFGFSAEKTGALRLPGPYEPERLLGAGARPRRARRRARRDPRSARRGGAARRRCGRSPARGRTPHKSRLSSSPRRRASDIRAAPFRSPAATSSTWRFAR